VTAAMPNRLLIVLCGLAVLVFGTLALRSQGPGAAWLPGCLFHRVTGLDCPGCGMTRAAHATLHGDLAAAFRFNPLGMILLPLALIGIGLEIVGWVRGRPLPWTFRVRGRWVWGIVAAVFVFWIARNIPAWPFNLLAPP
jgi:Protein of unknown function (DUF2752)